MAKLQKLLHAPASPETMTKRQRWSALGLLSAGLLLVTMDMTILLIALPDLIAELQSTATEQLWIVDVYSLIFTGLLIPMSALADRIGRRKTLLIGFALFGLMSLLVLFATNSATVIAL
jgi:antiseptic resistance protein